MMSVSPNAVLLGFRLLETEHVTPRVLPGEPGRLADSDVRDDLVHDSQFMLPRCCPAGGSPGHR